LGEEWLCVALAKHGLFRTLHSFNYDGLRMASQFFTCYWQSDASRCINLFTYTWVIRFSFLNIYLWSTGNIIKS
jgi:hypothetical protein